MKNQHITSDLAMANKELGLREREARCLNCGLEEAASWQYEGPTAPPVSEALLGKVRGRQQREWLDYAYKIAAGLVVLVLFFQLGNDQGSSASDAPQEAAHFLVDSARNDTAFLLKDDLSEDTVKAVSIHVGQDEAEEQSTERDLVVVLTGDRGLWNSVCAMTLGLEGEREEYANDPFRQEEIMGILLSKNNRSGLGHIS